MNTLVETGVSLDKEIQLLQGVESMLVDAIPGMIAKASDKALKMSLAHHLAETRQHKVFMEFIAKQLNVSLESGLNKELTDLIGEGEKEMANYAPGKSLDTVLIATAKKIEQYEIQAYEKTANDAEHAGHVTIAAKLRSILQEEKQAETKLNFLAKNIGR